MPEGYSQNGASLYNFWNQGPVNGEISLRGLYRDQKSILGELEENQQSTYFSGGIRLNTSLFLWKPDIVKLYIGGEYNPESRDEKYLIVPDRSESRSLSKLNLRAEIFNNKSVNINTYLNIDQNYFNREYLTNIKSDNRQWGGLLGFNNKFLPMTFTFRNMSWDQTEIQNNRTFSMEQTNLESRITKSFSSYDRSELRLSYDDYNYNYNLLGETTNQVKRASFNNSTWFDRDRNYSLNSNFLLHDQSGSYDFKRIEIIENLNMLISNNLRITSGYNLYQLSDIYQEINSNRASIRANHKLFESLYTSVYTEITGINQTTYKESDFRGGFDVRYTKKVLKSKLNIGYKYFRQNSSMESSASIVRIVNEPLILDDGQITILKKPYIELSSITIRDITGTILYQENLDYILSANADFVQVSRVPGGQISNGQELIVEYNATQPGSYTYHANNNSLSASISFFKNKFEIYYQGSSQSYPYIIDTEFLTLNRYYQNIYGARMNLGLLNGGVEYDNYNSNIIPYKRIRYYLSSNLPIRSKLLMSVNCNISDYSVLDESFNQLYSSANARALYKISPSTQISLEAGYLSQVGKNIDLQLLTSRAELSHSVRRLHFKAGFEMYRRHYLESDIYFTGTYINISRKF